MAWPAQLDVRLGVAQRLARGDADLLHHEVDAREHLRHRMLHLDAAVDLDEVERARARRPGTRACPGSRSRPPRRPGPPARRGPAAWRVEGRAGRLLHDLLVAALDGAVALADVDAVAVAVDDDLDLDVAVVLQPLLEVQRVVAEGGARLRAADGDGLLELPRRAHHAHAPAAAARRRLDQHRVADALRPPRGRGRRRAACPPSRGWSAARGPPAAPGCPPWTRTAPAPRAAAR